MVDDAPNITDEPSKGKDSAMDYNSFRFGLPLPPMDLSAEEKMNFSKLKYVQGQVIYTQKKFNEAKAELKDILRQQCPGDHKIVSHPGFDKKWCESCGRDKLGDVIAVVIHPPKPFDINANKTWHEPIKGDEVATIHPNPHIWCPVCDKQNIKSAYHYENDELVAVSYFCITCERILGERRFGDHA